MLYFCLCFFFFTDTATTEIYTLSLHDALPIYPGLGLGAAGLFRPLPAATCRPAPATGAASAAARGSGSASGDRKSTRLNSSHSQISYAVFCLKKKKK